jgi:hypothetical protein
MCKGKVSEDEYLFEGPKNENNTFCMSADGFHNFWLCFLKNIQNMFLVAS